MPIKANVVSSGITPRVATVVVGTVNNNLTAAGTNQATALTLGKFDNHVFTTVGIGTGAVLRPDYSPADTIRVANHGANNLLLYPAIGGTIAHGATNAPIAIIPTGQAVLTSIDGSGLNWAVTVSATPSAATGTVTSVSVVTANGVSGTVANPTTTPAITLTVQKASSSQFGIVEVDGTTITATAGVISAVGGGATGANPTAIASDIAVNGVAATFMRSDASPAVQKATSSQFGVIEVDNSTIVATGGIVSVATGPLFHPGLASGAKYAGPLFTSIATNTFAANIRYATPFYCPQIQTFTNQGVYTTTSSGTIQLGVYNNNNGIPTSLLADNGTLTLGVLLGFHELTGLSFTLQVGWYWLAMVLNQSTVLEGSGTNYIINYLRGYWSGSITAGLNNVTATQTFGALPGTFPTVIPTNASNPISWISF